MPVVVSESFTLMGLVMSTVWSESLLQAVTSRPRVAARSSVWILLVFILVYLFVVNNKLLIGYFCVILGVCQLRNGGFGK